MVASCNCRLRRQESAPDSTESDGPVRNEPRRTNSQSQIDEPAGRELLTCTDDTPVAVHCQETTTPGSTANPFGTQRYVHNIIMK